MIVNVYSLCVVDVFSPSHQAKRRQFSRCGERGYQHEFC